MSDSHWALGFIGLSKLENGRRVNWSGLSLLPGGGFWKEVLAQGRSGGWRGLFLTCAWSPMARTPWRARRICQDVFKWFSERYHFSLLNSMDFWALMRFSIKEDRQSPLACFITKLFFKSASPRRCITYWWWAHIFGARWASVWSLVLPLQMERNRVCGRNSTNLSLLLCEMGINSVSPS